MMLTVSLDDPIAVLAVRRPGLLPLLDRLGIDYCCHGSDSVSQACVRAGVDPARLLAEMEAAAAADRSEPSPTPITMTELCDSIEQTHHASARSLLDHMSTVAPRVADVHGARHSEFAELNAVIGTLRSDMLDHMVREERVLFPWIRRLETPHALRVGPPWSVRRPIDCMIHDHDEVAAALARMRTLTRGFTPPSDACGSVTALFNVIRELDQDTRRHVHKENNILFPAAIAAENPRGGHAPARTTKSG